jgi:hypothetical protein
VLLLAASSVSAGGNDAVKVFHFVTPAWCSHPHHTSIQRCRNDMQCEWVYASDMDAFEKLYREHASAVSGNASSAPITVAAYNVHSLYHFKHHKPQDNRVPADLRLATSEESSLHPKYSTMFPTTFPHFDGYTIFNPKSTFQRIISDAWLNETVVRDFTTRLTPFHQLIKGGTFVASNCRSSRDGLVQSIRDAGWRVDGLGNCLHSSTPEAIANKLDMKNDVGIDSFNKRTAISKYMFHVAFENQQEPGYVTEKPFDALYAGTVPIYRGDAQHLRALLPHPDAAIFMDDYKDTKALVEYLQLLSQDEKAYEKHRAWRHNYSYEGVTMNNPLLRDTFWCKVCQWAVNMSHAGKLHNAHQRTNGTVGSLVHRGVRAKNGTRMLNGKKNNADSRGEAMVG